ncbi:MAG: glycosyltransferase [Bacteroidales bacterium]|nr:MAG: glycosyltransferase [Bacteroidales bacterium]
MRRVLIITYYWPPAGSSGVQRWLKFVKYLREFGWEPVVYTANNPEVAALDESLSNDIPEGVEVIKRNVPEPYKLYKLITGNRGKKIGVGFTSGTSKNGLLNRLAIWIRGNFFIPDARMFWIAPSARYLSKYLINNPVDIIITTGPPHSLHLIGLKLKRRFNIPWIADFRDPWTEIYFYKDLKLTGIADRINHYLEKKVLKNSNLNVVVSKSMADAFINIGAKRVEIVSNGFDHSDYHFSAAVDDKFFSIVHVGTIPPGSNSNSFWGAVSKMAKKNDEFNQRLRIQFVGEIDSSVVDSLKANNLLDKVELIGYKPHSEIPSFQKSAQVLLVLAPRASKEILTGKIFEYLAANRPIIAIGPIGGDLDKLLIETEAGIMLPSDSQTEIYEGLKWFWDGYKSGWSSFNPKNINKYSRKELTRRMSELMLELINP